MNTISNTLCISDLDGTLLGNDCKISPESAEILNDCIHKGVKFSFATARSAASAVKIAECLDMNIPCILMNGVCIYDLKQKKYIRTEYLPREDAEKVANLLESLGQSGFIYEIRDNKLICSYNKIDNPEMLKFYQQRKEKYDKPFAKTESLSSAVTDKVIYFTLLDSFEHLDRVRTEIQKIKGLKFEFYKDIYSENSWYMEIFSENASKYNGVKFLREQYSFDEVVCFGDNLNDLPMFRASDIRIAVENANPQVKSEADEITLSNTENGVALWIKNHTTIDR